jgi:hypothetical protein
MAILNIRVQGTPWRTEVFPWITGQYPIRLGLQYGVVNTLCKRYGPLYLASAGFALTAV